MKKIMCISHSTGWILFLLCSLAAFGPVVKASTVPRSNTLRPYQEIKFIAGKDEKWFTNDDEIYDYSLAEYNTSGKMVKRARYLKGPDNTAFTPDDQKQDYYLYEYDSNLNPLRESYYRLCPEGKSKEVYSSVFEGEPGSKKNKAVRYKDGQMIAYTVHEHGPHGKVAQVVEYTGPGPDTAWFTSDDEIEKYHVRYYDEKGRFVKAVECSLTQKGKGVDNTWFTNDDEISSVKIFSYDPRGLIDKTYKYIGKGPDGIWFTDDDLLQYYTARYYKEVKGNTEDDTLF